VLLNVYLHHFASYRIDRVCQSVIVSGDLLDVVSVNQYVSKSISQSVSQFFCQPVKRFLYNTDCIIVIYRLILVLKSAEHLQYDI
jgi:hypothetical protein